MDAVAVINQIISGNTEFVNNHGRSYFESHMSKQVPFMTLVSCADSRVPGNAILPDTVNKVFSIENIGNQVLASEGSIDYGIYHLKTPVLMILGHSDCGAIKAYMKGFDNETYNIKHDLDFLKPIINNYSDDTDVERHIAMTIQENIDYQVNVAYKKYKGLIKEGKLVVLGAYYDFKNEFNRGYERVVIVNINRVNEEKELNQLASIQSFNSGIRAMYIGRLT